MVFSLEAVLAEICESGWRAGQLVNKLLTVHDRVRSHRDDFAQKSDRCSACVGGRRHDSQKAMKRVSALFAVMFLISPPANADELMRSVQQKLQAQGFYSGSIDGLYGSQTAAAIRRYQVAEGLKVTGELNPQTLSKLGLRPRSQKSAPEPEYVAITQIFKGGPYITSATELQIATIRQAQKTLKLLGYYGGPINGRPDARLVTALKAWQKSAGFRQTGRLDETTLKGLDIMPD